MLPIDHELTRRLQFWADTVRVKMIELMPELATVPAPQVRVLKSDTVNAFAQYTRVSAVQDIAAPSAPAAIPEGQEVVLGKECSPGCPKFKGDINAKRMWVEAGQKRINRDCTVQTVNGVLQLSESCLTAPGSAYQGPRRFNRYNGSQVVNYISILSEAIKVMSEDDMVVTMAHELGHYYLAHPVYLDVPDPSAPYNYLYIKSEKPSSGKPEPLAPNDPNYALVKEFDETVDFSFPPIEGQQYPTVIGLAIARTLADGLNQNRIVDRCVTGTDVQQCLAKGYEVTKPGQVFSDWAFRTKGDTSNPASFALVTASALKFEEALGKNSSMIRASTLSSLQEKLATYIGRSAPSVQLSGDKDETVASFLPAYIEKAKLAIEENSKIVARLTQAVSDKGLGFYTAEQEADDVATEILYELSFDPEVIVKNWLHFLDRSAEPQIKKDSCKANYQSGFKTPVWIGLSTEPHHGDCYRAYNAYQEIENHRETFEKNKSKSKPIAPGGKWEDLVSAMKGKNFIAIPTP
jgi:hypothetical protein